MDDRSVRTFQRAVLVVAGLVAVVIVFAVFRPDRAVVDQRVDDALPQELADALGPAASTQPQLVGPPASDPGTASPAPSQPPGPVLVADGTFTGQAGHQVQGRAAVLDTGTGLALVLENLDSDNGPDLQLYLSPSSDGSVDNGRFLEPLRGNQGTQLYALPDDADLGATPNVVIWCERFSTPFGTATLVPVPAAGT